MNWIRNRLINLNYEDEITIRQAQALYLVLGIISVVLVFGFTLAVATEQKLITIEQEPPLLVISGAMIVVLVVWIVMYFGRLRLALGLIFAIGYGMVATITYQQTNPQMVVALPILFTVMSAMMVPPRAVLVVGGTFIALWVGHQALGPGVTFAELPVIVVQVAILIFSYLLARGWQLSQRFFSDVAAQQRLRMVELSADVTSVMFRRRELESLLDNTVNLVRDQFDQIYHAQIFLNNEPGDFAELKASTGEAGRKLLERKHRLPVGGQSVIGQVTVSSEPVLTRDTQGDTVHRVNELLPDTRTELALPLIMDDAIIGALDVQSLSKDAFSPDDITALQTLANQIAIAIDNARLFEKQQAVVQENQQLADRAQAQVKQIQDLNQRLTRQAWGEYYDVQALTPALTVEFDTGARTPNAELTSGLQEAVETGGVVFDTGDDGHVLAVPLQVRGQVIGAMEFEVGDQSMSKSEQAAIAQDVASSLALSLESARLFDEAQRLAQREAVINDIGARLQTASGIENALAMAAQGLQSALNAPHVAIRLGAPPPPTGTLPDLEHPTLPSHPTEPKAPAEIEVDA